MVKNTIKEEDYALLIKRGDRSIFTLVFHQYKEVLFRHAYRILRDMDDTEDVVQEVFTVLWEKRDQLPDGISISGYLYKMVRHRVLNKLNRHKVIDNYINHIVWQNDVYEQDADALLLEKELAEIIELEVQKLPSKMKQVFLLSRKEGLSHKEIAEILQISEGTSKLQVSNALRLLREGFSKALTILLVG